LKNVAVVILNWNGKKYLQKFLPSVVKYSQEADIIVADNQSTDDSISFLKDNYPKIKIIINKKNYGFAEGYNQALKNVNYPYYVLLNSDVEVTDNWIKPVINLFEKDEKIAAIQPKIKNYHQKEYFEYAGAAGGWIDKYGYPFCRGRIFDTIEKDEHQYDDETEIFWASGASLFIRSKLFHKMGGFDSFFFAHMEEIDLCWRLKNNGYKIMYCPLSTIYHVGGGTLNKSNPHKTFLNFRNNLLLLHKNLPHQNRWRIIFIRLCLDTLAGVQFILKGDFKHCVAIIKAHFNFYSNVEQNNKKISFTSQKNYAGMLKKSILLSYFLKNHKIFSNIEK